MTKKTMAWMRVSLNFTLLHPGSCCSHPIVPVIWPVDIILKEDDEEYQENYILDDVSNPMRNRTHVWVLKSRWQDIRRILVDSLPAETRLVVRSVCSCCDAASELLTHRCFLTAVIPVPLQVCCSIRGTLNTRSTSGIQISTVSLQTSVQRPQ